MATLAVYLLAQGFYARVQQAPWANPVLWSVVVIGVALLVSRVPYQNYFAGAQFIHFLLGPAVVALGLPLWERRAELRATWGRLALALARDWAIMEGASVMRLEVNHHNARAKALYLSAGYRDDERDILTLPLAATPKGLHR